MRKFNFKCENCNINFESEYPLDVLLPRCLPIMCDSCTNKGMIEQTKEKIHGFIDGLFSKLLGK